MKVLIKLIPLAILILLMFLLGCSQNTGQCVPDTLERLSKLSPITNATSSRQFAKLLKTTPSGTLMTDIDIAWDSVYTNHILIPILVAKGESLYADPDYHIEFGHPYLWVGRHEQGNHCALLYVSSNSVVLSHSQFVPGTKSYFTEERPVSWLLTNTYRLWYVK